MIVETKNNLRRKILIVDDEKDILDLISYNFVKAGFDVFTAESGRKGLTLAKKYLPDLIILDLMMPEMDGIEFCQEVRKTDALKHILVVFLTARNEDYTQIAIYDSGADDYISKPISPRVLLSKVHALLRRPLLTETSKGKVGKHIVVDSRAYKVYKGNQEIELPRKEFELLHLFVENPNVVLKREYIFQKVWGNDVIVGDRTLDVYIRKIRSKLGDEYIITIKGVGYKFEE